MIDLAGHFSIERLIVAAIFAAIVALAGTRARALTRSGAIAAFAVGTAALGFGGLALAVPVVVFFVSGTALSRVRHPRASVARDVAYKGSTRDAAQVLANGGAAAACAIFIALSPSRAGAAWLASAVGALAVAAADTWATEIGILAPDLPRSILSLRRVRPGVSGGVTLLGLIASVAGGALIGAAAGPFAQQLSEWKWTALGASVGFAGSALDSLLGAATQAQWRCDSCDLPCEGPIHRCGARTRFVRGLRFVDNDAVNAIATTAGAVLGWIAMSILA